MLVPPQPAAPDSRSAADPSPDLVPVPVPADQPTLPPWTALAFAPGGRLTLAEWTYVEHWARRKVRIFVQWMGWGVVLGVLPVLIRLADYRAGRLSGLALAGWYALTPLLYGVLWTNGYLRYRRLAGQADPQALAHAHALARVPPAPRVRRYSPVRGTLGLLATSVLVLLLLAGWLLLAFASRRGGATATGLAIGIAALAVGGGLWWRAFRYWRVGKGDGDGDGGRH